jgi:hypothetical protein
VVNRVTKIEMTIYNSVGVGWESGDPGRVVDGDGANLILQFQLDVGDDMMKHCRKMKRRERARLRSMTRKCDTMRQHDNVGWRRGGTKEGKGRRRRSWDDANLTG